jgi:hypothetical protein
MAIVRFLGYAGLAFVIFLIVIALATALVVAVDTRFACTDVAQLQQEYAVSERPHEAELLVLPDYVRDEQVTFLTFPEWYIVYSAREYAAHLEGGTPSSFPYNRSTAQFWCSYKILKSYTNENYPRDTWWHVALVTIGSSFAAENLVQEIYEVTIGNLSLLGGGANTPEDQLQREVAADYAKFLDTIPWYRYPFLDAVGKLWSLPATGEHMGRKWERRIALTIGYSIKGAYGWLMGKAVNDTGVYEPADLTILMTVRYPLPAKFAGDERIKLVKDFEDGTAVIEVPRYQAFTELMTEFAWESVRIYDISANRKLLISVLAHSDWKYNLPGEQFFSMPVAIDSAKKRVIAVVPNSELLDTVRRVGQEKIVLEHIYDY